MAAIKRKSSLDRRFNRPADAARDELYEGTDVFKFAPGKLELVSIKHLGGGGDAELETADSGPSDGEHRVSVSLMPESDFVTYRLTVIVRQTKEQAAETTAGPIVLAEAGNAAAEQTA